MTDTTLHRWPGNGETRLCSAQETAALETQARAAFPPGALMQRAGRSAARLARVLAPAGQSAWVICGPGNNGGDGFVAALLLARLGWRIEVSLVEPPAGRSAEAQGALDALLRAMAEEDLPVHCRPSPPTQPVDLVIDALFGTGLRREPGGLAAEWIAAMGGLHAPVLAIDLPSGLDADTGQPLGRAVRADATLALLTLKPGLFTGAGRDHCGELWFDPLGAGALPWAPRLALVDVGLAASAWPERRHALHKGRFGDVRVVGGATGMVGAAWLAATAAAAAGAGRVWVALLDPAAPGFSPARPELMWAPAGTLQDAAALGDATVVAGCGGGADIARVLPALLHHAPRLVLDADGLNAVARDDTLRHLLRHRQARGQATVLTPHPLEAARLLGADVGGIQADRVAAARRLALDLLCTVLLKGSGTVLADADGRALINPTGNARLASAGTGDVLAGWLGGLWGQQPLLPAVAAGVSAVLAVAASAAWLHGRAAEHGGGVLRAADLIEAMRHEAQALSRGGGPSG